MVIVTNRGIVKKCELDVLSSKKRRSEPTSIIPMESKDMIHTLLTCRNNDVVVVITAKGSFEIHVDELPTKLKYQLGDKMVPLKKGDVIAKVFKLNLNS